MGSELHEIIKLIDLFGIYFVVVPYLANRFGHYFRIKKIYNHKKIIKVSVPPKYKKKYDNIELNKINNKTFKEVALEFSKVLIEHFPEEALTNFYNNLNELTIKNNKLIVLIGAGGCYAPLNNSITISDFDAIYHELFHMASRLYSKSDGVSYVGFKQRSTKLSKITYNGIGTGLNEGYTEVLTHRYFRSKTYSSYEFETDIARKLEMIIGSDKMTDLYLKGDLSGLINELKKYMPEDEIIKFITRIDLINEYEIEHKSIIVRESIFDIYEFLLKANALKLKMQYDEGLIDISTFKTLSNDYLDSFKTVVYLPSIKYELRNIEEMYNIILKDINAPGYIENHFNSK